MPSRSSWRRTFPVISRVVPTRLGRWARGEDWWIAEEQIPVTGKDAKDPATRILMHEALDSFHQHMQGASEGVSRMERQCRVDLGQGAKIPTAPLGEAARGQRHELHTRWHWGQAGEAEHGARTRDPCHELQSIRGRSPECHVALEDERQLDGSPWR